MESHREKALFAQRIQLSLLCAPCGVRNFFPHKEDTNQNIFANTCSNCPAALLDNGHSSTNFQVLAVKAAPVTTPGPK
jgi:hypothetical protein